MFASAVKKKRAEELIKQSPCPNLRTPHLASKPSRIKDLFALGHIRLCHRGYAKENRRNAKQYLNRSLLCVEMQQQTNEKLCNMPGI